MLVEIHLLQNHAPSNLNRDDTGSPKDCIFGGVLRARISSQCLKRSIRRSPLFTSALKDVELGIRTRKLPDRVKENLLERGLSEEMAKIAAAKASGFGTKDGKEQKDPETAQMMFLTPGDIKAVADVLYEAAQKGGDPKTFEKVEAKVLQDQAVLKGWRPITPDIALFGRMITSGAFRDVEASVQVAHALSTHKITPEYDYFTAVDDLPKPVEAQDEKGAGMIGDVEFNSACYYKYFSLDLSGLVDNLAGPAVEGETLRQAEALARRTVLAFLKAAVFTTPSGKQNTFAAHQLPAAILVELREDPIPVSYANAFVKPVRAEGGADLVEQSISALAAHVKTLTEKYSLKSAARLWFTVDKTVVSGATVCDTFDDLLGKLASELEGRMVHG